MPGDQKRDRISDHLAMLARMLLEGKTPDVAKRVAAELNRLATG